MMSIGKILADFIVLRPACEVCEAQLHKGYKLCVIGAIPLQTYESVWWWSPKDFSRGGDALL